MIRAMELGLLAPSYVSPLLDTLEEGFITGAGRVTEIRQYAKPTTGLTPFPKERPLAEPVLITTTLGSRKRAYAKARAAAQAGQPTTLFDFSMNARMLTVRFTDDGYWLHKGGIFGRSERKGRMFFFNTFRQRIAQESIRVAVQRKIGIAVK